MNQYVKNFGVLICMSLILASCTQQSAHSQSADDKFSETSAQVTVYNRMQSIQSDLLDQILNYTFEFDRHMAVLKATNAPEQERSIVLQYQAEALQTLEEVKTAHNLMCNWIQRLSQEVDGQEISLIEDENGFIILEKLEPSSGLSENLQAMPAGLYGIFGNLRDTLLLTVARHNRAYPENFRLPTAHKDNPDDGAFAENLQESWSTYWDEKPTLMYIADLLSLPKNAEDGSTSWILDRFQGASLISVMVALRQLDIDILLAGKAAMANTLNQIHIPVFIFNKIEVAVIPETNLPPNNDSTVAYVRMVSYNTELSYQIRYWLDDKRRKPSNMYETSTNRISVLAAPGRHTLYGEMAVKEKGMLKWKPWQYTFTVPE